MPLLRPLAGGLAAAASAVERVAKQRRDDAADARLDAVLARARSMRGPEGALAVSCFDATARDRLRRGWMPTDGELVGLLDQGLAAARGRGGRQGTGTPPGNRGPAGLTELWHANDSMQGDIAVLQATVREIAGVVRALASGGFGAGAAAG